MKKKLIILGSSGLAREMAMLAEQINVQQHRWEIEGFICSDPNEIGKDLGLAKVIGDDHWLIQQNSEVDLVIGVGYPKLRKTIIEKYIHLPQFKFPNLIHPSVEMDFNRVQLGIGNAITAGVVLTCDIQMGSFNLFNLNSTVGHDVEIKNFCVINPGVNISGGVTLGEEVFVGTGAQILENLSIGDRATVGAAALVRRDVLEDQIAVGVPAKHLQN